jgi:uncharacterized protein (TIRG00374 family)
MSAMKKRIAILSVFGIIVLALLLYYVNPGEYYQALRDFPVLLGGVYLVIIGGSYFLRSFRWKELLSTTGCDTSIKFTWRTLHAAWFVNWITPLRIGEMVRLYSAKKNEGISYGANSAAIAIEHIFDLIAILIISCLSLIITLQLSQVPDNTIIILVLALAAIIGLIVLVLVLLFFGKKVARLAKPISQELYENLLRLHSSFKTGFKIASKKPVKLTLMALLSFVIWVIETTMLYILIIGLNMTQVPFSITTLAGSIGFLTFTVPLLPGNIGTYEAVFVAILSIAGITPRKALQVPLTDRVIKSIYMLALGLPLLLAEGINFTRLREIEEEVEEYMEEEEDKLVMENSIDQ